MNRKMQLITIFLLATLLLSSCDALSTVLEAPLFAVEERETVRTAPVESAPVTPAEPTGLPAVTTPLADNTGNAASSDILASLEGAYNAIYTKVIPSVVNVSVVLTASEPPVQTPDFPFMPGQPFGQQPPRGRRGGALGSGFIWDLKGHIITNNHVVEGAERITVTFADGSSAKATIIGADPDSDLAVIRVDVAQEKLRPIAVADSTQVQVGDIAIAIGNPFGLEGSMTTGIVSALGRSLDTAPNALTGSTYTIPDVIQTDTAINPGNSGGVLVNKDGNLIGVTAAIKSTAGSNAGIGFVIPSVIVEKVVPILITEGIYQHPRIGFSGTTLTSALAEAMNLDPDQRGALVVDITPGSPAEKGGLHGSDRQLTLDEVELRIGGDVITRIEGQPVNDFEDIVAYLARYTEVGETIQLTVLRDGSEQTLAVTLEAREQSRPTEEPPQTVQTSTAWLGVLGITLNPDIAEAMDVKSDQTGVLVQRVVQGSPADKAKLNGSYKAATLNGQEVMIGGDIITAVNGKSVQDMNALKAALAAFKAGDEIELTLIRAGEQATATVTLEKKPQ